MNKSNYQIIDQNDSDSAEYKDKDPEIVSDIEFKVEMFKNDNDLNHFNHEKSEIDNLIESQLDNQNISQKDSDSGKTPKKSNAIKIAKDIVFVLTFIFLAFDSFYDDKEKIGKNPWRVLYATTVSLWLINSLTNISLGINQREILLNSISGIKDKSKQNTKDFEIDKNNYRLLVPLTSALTELTLLTTSIFSREQENYEISLILFYVYQTLSCLLNTKFKDSLREEKNFLLMRKCKYNMIKTIRNYNDDTANKILDGYDSKKTLLQGFDFFDLADVSMLAINIIAALEYPDKLSVFFQVLEKILTVLSFRHNICEYKEAKNKLSETETLTNTSIKNVNDKLPEDSNIIEPEKIGCLKKWLPDLATSLFGFTNIVLFFFGGSDKLKPTKLPLKIGFGSLILFINRQKSKINQKRFKIIDKLAKDLDEEYQANAAKNSKNSNALLDNNVNQILPLNKENVISIPMLKYNNNAGEQ